MEKGIIETVDNFLDSLGTTGRVTIELADPTGVTGWKDLSNATETLKEKKNQYEILVILHQLQQEPSL